MEHSEAPRLRGFFICGETEDVSERALLQVKNGLLQMKWRCCKKTGNAASNSRFSASKLVFTP